MKEILKKPWNYTFFEKNDKLYLSVVCGGVAIFEINIELNEKEVLLYKEDGITYIDNLAKEIQNSPAKYSSRSLSDDALDL